jgi:hypothetical protein
VRADLYSRFLNNDYARLALENLSQYPMTVKEAISPF